MTSTITRYHASSNSLYNLGRQAIRDSATFSKVSKEDVVEPVSFTTVL